MKSVTKSYSSLADGSDLGLTQVQTAGLYSVYMNGSVLVNNNTATANCMAFRYGGGNSDSAGYNSAVAQFKGTAWYNTACYNLSVGASSGKARLSTVGPFTGSITFYYFE